MEAHADGTRYPRWGARLRTLTPSRPPLRPPTRPLMGHNRWYEKGLRFECTRCGNCCTSHGEYTHVYLAERDVRALAAHLGLSRRRFLARYCEREDGRVLLRMDAPECPFLSSEGTCSVYPARPRQCRTWPFWEENLERAAWEGPIAATCPGIGRGPLVPADEVERLARETEEWYEGGVGDDVR